MRLLIAGGGTGGHLYPGVAVAQELLSREGGHEVRFAGNSRGLEAKVLPSLGLSMTPIRSGGLVGVGALSKLRGGISTVAGFKDSAELVASFRPDACLGVGGYVSFPVVAYCALRGIPSAVQEQNAVAGVTNRLLGKVVKRVYLGDPSAAKDFPPKKILWTGNPLRQNFSAPFPYFPPRAGEEFRVLVLGGSQGAASLNRIVPEALRSLSIPVSVVHQCGKGKEEGVAGAYEGVAGIHVIPFIDEMAKAYAWAHLVIARAGALTLAELAAVGRPAILIPFPFAAGNHQEANALSAQEKGAAICVTEKELDAPKIAALVEGFSVDSSILEKMAESAAQSAKRRAAADIVDDLLRLSGRGDR
ncbi:undecaprenyldiphospho-muramoylpentapeptide beta-N-acetylglucosaminyltransferase [bacterium]|nr:MAG: undecaprenyldiphospho-muramoylpentapeptide beta-N-acetylglucosaminyltransferase [bacterium]